MKTPRVRIAETIAAHTYYDGAQKPYVKQIAAYLLSEHRAGELDSLLRDIQADWTRHGYVEVLARAAHPLSDDAKRDIAAQIKQLFPKAEKVVVTEVIDPDVLGGVVVRLADRQLDLSAEGKLNKFKQLVGSRKD